MPEKVDLVVITTPAPSVPGIIKDCVDLGIQSAIVISAGFKEIGPKARSWSARSWSRRGAATCA